MGNIGNLATQEIAQSLQTQINELKAGGGNKYLHNITLKRVETPYSDKDINCTTCISLQIETDNADPMDVYAVWRWLFDNGIKADGYFDANRYEYDYPNKSYPANGMFYDQNYPQRYDAVFSIFVWENQPNFDNSYALGLNVMCNNVTANTFELGYRQTRLSTLGSGGPDATIEVIDAVIPK